MCLSSIEFSTERKIVEGKKEFVGIGYKVMSNYEVTHMIGKWKSAKPWNGMSETVLLSNNTEIQLLARISYMD